MSAPRWASPILAIGTLLATRPRISPNVIAGILALCAVGVVAAGVASAARGERVVEHEEPAAGGNQPHVPPGTNHATTTTVAEAG